MCFRNGSVGKGIYCKLDIVQSHAVEGEDQHHKLSSDFFPDTLVLTHAYTTLTHIYTQAHKCTYVHANTHSTHTCTYMLNAYRF